MRRGGAFNEAKALPEALIWSLSPSGNAGREPERGVLIRFDGAMPATGNSTATTQSSLRFPFFEMRPNVPIGHH